MKSILTNKISEKLDSFFTTKGLSSYKVAQITKISEPTIGRYRKGTSTPNGTNLDILLKEFPELQSYLTGSIHNNNIINNVNSDNNNNQIITGIKGNVNINTPSKEETPIQRGLIPTENKDKGCPLIPIDAIAGFGTGDNNGVSYEDCEHYIVPDFDKRGMDFLIRVSGSSMYPKYSNGDVLACKKITSITFFQWGKVYVIDSSQGALVKRIFEDKDNPDNIICVSDNKENYPPFSMPKDEIRSLSIVLGVVRLE